MATEDYRELLERLLSERDSKAAELTKLNNAIETIQSLLGEPPQTTSTIPEALTALSERHRQDPPRQTSPLNIRPDQFFGMSHTDAADAYLRMVGHAVHTKQIVEAIKRGGVPVGGVDPETTLYKALVRGTRRFVLVSPHTFGLSDFYPNRPRKEKKEPAKRRAKRKTKSEKSKKAEDKKIESGG